MIRTGLELDWYWNWLWLRNKCYCNLPAPLSFFRLKHGHCSTRCVCGHWRGGGGGGGGCPSPCKVTLMYESHETCWANPQVTISMYPSPVPVQPRQGTGAVPFSLFLSRSFSNHPSSQSDTPYSMGHNCCASYLLSTQTISLALPFLSSIRLDKRERHDQIDPTNLTNYIYPTNDRFFFFFFLAHLAYIFFPNLDETQNLESADPAASF